MSRLLESLKNAQQERSQVVSDDLPSHNAAPLITPVKRSRIWPGIALLLLVGVLVFGGFVLLQFVLNGIEPVYWWERFLMALSALSNS